MRNPRSPPPLQHPVPTHPQRTGTESPLGTQFPRDESNPYGPPQPVQPVQSRQPVRGTPVVNKIEHGYQRISSPGPPMPDAYNAAPQQRSNSSLSNPYGMSRTSSVASTAPNPGVYQPATAWYDGTSTPNAYPNVPYPMPPPTDSYAGEDTWNYDGTQNTQSSAIPSFSAGGMMNDATAQMGMQFGRHVAQVGGEYMQKNLNALLPMPVLKHYFNVSNSYVLHKLRIILFPWRHKPWSRKLQYGGGYGGSGIMSPSSTPQPYGAPDRLQPDPRRNSMQEPVSFCPPREDVNSPDMYIPLLGFTASRALAIIVIEFIIVKLGCYLLNIQGDHTVVDLLAFAGYKFVGTLLVLAVGMLQMGRTLYWLTFLYVFAANAFFLLRSLRYVILPDPSSPSNSTITPLQRSTRIQFLFAIAVSQIIFGWLLVIGVY
ncbi:hypothetical protein MVES_001494 [Malassezia vespertilionis]|uniref:Uncharacterized protein n=1 Tax=Malassezia vespertilionis TaxID=2020962 RepID=A0A2N1JD35_9BASI|nr:hypothetical protein MVES_001494 [Malassezia vespertilionis]